MKRLLLLGVLFMSAAALPAVEGAAYLKIPQGARPTALGSAFSAVQGGVESIWYSPAGLAGIHGFEAGLSRMAWIGETHNDFLALALPMGPVAVGAFGNLLSTQDTYRDAVGNHGSSFGDSAYASGISLAMSKGPIAFGVTGKYYGERFESLSAAGFAADLGAQLSLWQERLHLGFAAQNLGSLSGYDLTLGGFAPPQTFRFGLAVDHVYKGLLFTQEFRVLPVSHENTYAAGLEYAFKTGGVGIQTRLGYESAGLVLGDLAGLAIGAGVTLDQLQVDLAWLPEGILGNPYRLSLLWRFAGAPQAADADSTLSFTQPVQSPESRVLKAKQFEAAGRNYFKLGRKAEAIQAFDQSLALQPNAELKAWLDQYRSLPPH